MYKMLKNIDVLKNLKKPKDEREWDPIVFFIYGRAGKQLAGVIFYASTEKWWDGYKGEESIIINDFYGCIKWNPFLNLIDRVKSKQQLLHPEVE